MIKYWTDDAWEEFEYWSRHIDEKNRLVYKIENDIVKIIQCGFHYKDK